MKDFEIIFKAFNRMKIQGKTNGFRGVYRDVHNEKTACFNAEDSPNGAFVSV